MGQVIEFLPSKHKALSSNPSTAKQKKMWYVYTIYYSIMKNNEIMSSTGNWMELWIIILSEINQNEKDKCHIFLLICRIYTMYICYMNVEREHVAKG
jgi:hypothetical protein